MGINVEADKNGFIRYRNSITVLGVDCNKENKKGLSKQKYCLPSYKRNYKRSVKKQTIFTIYFIGIQLYFLTF